MNSRRLKIAFLLGKFPVISETFILDQITGLLDLGCAVDIFARPGASNLKIQTEVETYRLLERTYYTNAPTSRLASLCNVLGMTAKILRMPHAAAHPLNILQAMNMHAIEQPAGSLRLLYLLYPLLKHGPYDVIHCHFGTVGLAGLKMKEMGVPGKLVVSFHGQDMSQFLTAQGSTVYQHLLDQADLLMPISKYWKQRLFQLGADPGRIQVHAMGIHLDRFAFHPRSLQPGDEIRLLTVGRLVEKKGIAFALRALSTLQRRHPAWRIHYDIIGSGEQENELRRLIAELGLQDGVRLLGVRTREEVYQSMQAGHIFLLPSITDSKGDQEGIPVTLMEAMATGMPVLSTRHTGIPELVCDGRSGFLAAEKDVDGLVERLEYLISHPEAWPEMGQNGRRAVEASHDIHQLNRQLVQTYHALLSGCQADLSETPEEAHPLPDSLP